MKKVFRPSNYFLYAILPLCMLFPASCDKSSAVSPVTFAVFGNAGQVTDDGETFKSLAGLVNKSDADFSVDLGNRLPEGIASSGLETIWNAADKDYGKFTRPVYPVAGMQDIFDYESDLAYSSHYGPSWYSFDRGGITFIVLNTSDDSYRHGFGKGARIGEEQMDWLGKCLVKAGKSPVVLLMNRPLWNDDPAFWRDHLLKTLKKGKVSLIVTCGEEGLFDRGEVDGIRTVSTGCVGPVEEESPGLFPHALLVTVDGEKNRFRVLSGDGFISDGIPITVQTMKKFSELAKAITPPVLNTSSSWRISESLNMSLSNPFDFPLSGRLTFTPYSSTSWSIRPEEKQIIVEPKTKKTVYVDILGEPPDLAPLPHYQLELKWGNMGSFLYDNSLTVKISRPRTGRPLPISAVTADVISCDFSGESLGIPVSVKEPGMCGRLVIYRRNASDIPVCVFVSEIKDLKPSMNEFVWNGRDLEGRRVSPGPLAFMVFVYNKKAPVTWVANGPSDLWGTVAVEREVSGLTVKTHTDHSLVSYRISSSFAEPKPETLVSFQEILNGTKLNGFAFDGREKVFLLTQDGIASAVISGRKASCDLSFGDKGYFRFTGYRGRKAGNISFADGSLYVGIGGGIGKGPAILVIDSAEGKISSEIDLTGYFGTDPVPPAVTADKSGISVAHPDGEVILRLSPQGGLIWKNETGDRIGDRDTDGRSSVYGIGADRFGLSYVTAAGSSARCGVIGPDGRGLFQIIPAGLHGLRVCSVVPLVEGKESDGLYFLTCGGDIPYIFHVPYTVRTGTIVEKKR